MRYFKIAIVSILLFFSLINMIFVLDLFTYHSLILVLPLSLLGLGGFFLQKKLFNYFSKEFDLKRLFKDFEFPISLVNIRNIGIELAFAFFLASMGLNPITDVIEGKIPTFKINTLFLDLTLVTVILAILPSLSYILYTGFKNELFKE